MSALFGVTKHTYQALAEEAYSKPATPPPAITQVVSTALSHSVVTVEAPRHTITATTAPTPSERNKNIFAVAVCCLYVSTAIGLLTAGGLVHDQNEAVGAGLIFAGMALCFVPILCCTQSTDSNSRQG